ncbi:TOG array regulator of axonemal microtubules protein 1 [Centruroides vittatus]|uniref:TOG array regulator of axonemal microtubules protein 1 n=1 Tax=Centruroides vittatus TaxID=120091 RepID=UPI00350FFF82
MARYVYANCDGRNSVNDESVEAIKPIFYNDVDTRAVLHHLLEQNAQKRIEILTSLRSLVRRNRGNIPFHGTSRYAVFEVLSHVLDDVRWEVRYQCLLLISSILPHLNEDLDLCMSLILSKLISNLGHDNSNVCCVTVQILHWYLRNTYNLQQFLKSFIQFGLESGDYLTRKGSIRSINVLFTEDFACENLSILIECLGKLLIDGDTTLFYPVFLAMKKIKDIVGFNTFHLYLQRIDKEAVKMYERIEKNSGKETYPFISNNNNNNNNLIPSSAVNSKNYHVNSLSKKDASVLLEFCVIDQHTLEKLFSENWRYRVEGIEQIKLSINQISDIKNIVNHLNGFLQILSVFLEDNSLKVIMSTLDIFENLVEKLKENMRQFLRLIVTIITKYLGDGKVVIREKTIRIIHRLMHYNPPILVLNNMFECKYQRNARLREELLNRVTAAVLTFPSYNFEFAYLCEAVAPFLVDSKRRVRLAALECFAVLAQAMGTSRIVYLVSAVDAVELNYDSDGLMAAVQARLARRVLPRCAPDGSVLHALTLPSSAGGQNCFLSYSGADVDWIMSASGPLSISTPSRHRRIATSLPDINNPSWHNVKDIPISKKFSHTTNKKQSFEELPDKNNEITDEFVYMDNSYSPKYIFDKDDDKDDDDLDQLQWHTTLNQHLINNLKDEEVQCGNISAKYKKMSMSQNNSSPLLPAISSSSSSLSPSSASSSSSQTSSDLNNTEKEILDAHTPVVTSELENSEKMIATDANDEELPITTTGWGSDENHDKKISPDPDSSFQNKLIFDESPSPADNQSTIITNIDDLNESTFPSKMGNVGTHLFHSSGNVVAVADNDIEELNKKDEIKVEMIEPVENIIKIHPSANNSSSWSVKGIEANDGIPTELWQGAPDVLPEVYGDHSNISISKITRDRLLKRQQEILKEAEERKVIREKSRLERKQMLERRLQDERERQQRMQEVQNNNIANKVINDIDNLPNKINNIDEKEDANKTGKEAENFENHQDSANSEASVNSSSTTEIQVNDTKPKTEVPMTPGSSQTLPGSINHKFPSSSSLSLFDDKTNRHIPYPNPDEALKKALRCLANETWTVKIEGMQMISRLANCHADTVKGQLHSINIALLSEVKNLRSSVSRTAILTIGELFLKLKRNMETDLEVIVQTLLHKTGESVGFIRDDIEKAMNNMIEEVSSNKAILAVILGGGSHRNGAVRKTTAQVTATLVERIGAAKCLVGQKEITERLLPVAAQFLMDGVPLTRYHGRRIFQVLLPHPSFDKMLTKYVHQTTVRNIRGILETIRKKGIGEMPRERISAKVHKSNSSRSAIPSRTVP